jgi:hypothetical protein
MTIQKKLAAAYKSEGTFQTTKTSASQRPGRKTVKWKTSEEMAARERNRPLDLLLERRMMMMMMMMMMVVVMMLGFVRNVINVNHAMKNSPSLDFVRRPKRNAQRPQFNLHVQSRHFHNLCSTSCWYHHSSCVRFLSSAFGSYELFSLNMV